MHCIAAEFEHAKRSYGKILSHPRSHLHYPVCLTAVPGTGILLPRYAQSLVTLIPPE